MISIDRKGKCGEGAYGVVYEAKLTIQKDDTTKVQKVAVKRNYGDKGTKGVSCIREMNYLASLNHPCIIRLKSISVGDPFEKEKPWTPKPKRNTLMEDSHHFILEFSDYDLDTFMDMCKNSHQLKTIMCQLLLGMEFFHSKGVLHRDVKPPNVLVSMEQNIPYAKYCDFGLSCTPNKYRPSTPGAVTSWYRAPEICCSYPDYSFPSDIWSLGCVFYEIITKKPFVSSKKDDDNMIFNDIIEALPDNFTLEELEQYIRKGNAKKMFKADIPKKKNTSFESMIKPNINVRDFNKKGGSITEFCDLLTHMLCLEPSKRYTATQCLAHPFFASFKTFSDDMRKKYPPIMNMNQRVAIIDCIERKWAVNVLFNIYNKRQKTKWYSHGNIFQALRLFDEYLDYAYSREDVKLKDEITEERGRLNTKREVEIYMYTCIYIIYKHLNCLNKVYLWTNIFPPHLIDDETLSVMEEFEKYIIRKISKYVVYKPTFYDMISDEPDVDKKSQAEKELDIKNYLVNYGMIDSYDGPLDELYKEVKTFLNSQQQPSE